MIRMIRNSLFFLHTVLLILRGAELIDELMFMPGEYFIKKTRYSGFYGTNLDEVLTTEKVEHLYIVGVCTSICVMETVADLRKQKIILHLFFAVVWLILIRSPMPLL